MIITLKGATASKHLGGLNFYSISVNKSSGVTVTLDKTSVSKDTAASETVTGTLTVAEGYTLSSVKIMMGDTDKTSAWYNSSTGAITISGITANVTITAIAASNSGSGDSGSGETEETTTWYIDHANQLIDNNVDITAGSGLGINVGAFAYMDATNALLVGKPINTVQYFVHTNGKFTFYKWNKATDTLTEIESVTLSNAGTATLQTHKFSNEFTLASGEYLAFGNTTDVGKIYYYYNIAFGSAHNEKVYYKCGNGGTTLGSLVNLGMNIGYVG